MPGPEQPDKFTSSDKTSSTAGKADKSAVEKISQDAFGPPPTKFGSDSDTKSPPPDKPLVKDTGEWGKSGSKTSEPESPKGTDSFSVTKTSGDGWPVKPPQETPKSLEDFGKPPVETPAKTPPNQKAPAEVGSAAFGSDPPAKKPLEPLDKTPVKTPEKDTEPAVSPVKPPATDGFADKKPIDKPSGEPASKIPDGADLPKKQLLDKPPGETALRVSSPDTLPVANRPDRPADTGQGSRTPPGESLSRPPEKISAIPDGAESVAPRQPVSPVRQELDRGRPPAGSTPQPRDIAPRGDTPRATEAPAADRAARDAARNRETTARGTETASAARGAEVPREAGADRRTQAAPVDAEQRAVDASDRLAGQGAQEASEVAAARRGEAALAEILARKPAAQAAETGSDRAAPGLAARDRQQVPETGTARGGTPGETGREPRERGHPARAGAGGTPAHPGQDRIESPRAASPLHPEGRTPADTGARGRTDQAHGGGLRADRGDTPGTRSSQQTDGAAARSPFSQPGQADRQPGEAVRRLDDRGAAPQMSGEKSGSPALKPLEPAARAQDQVGAPKIDVTTTGARPAADAAPATKQPVRAPGDVPPGAQPGAGPALDATGTARQPDRIVADAQGQGRPPVKAPGDSATVRPPGATTPETRAPLQPGQAIADGRTAVPQDAAGRPGTARLDGAQRAPISKPEGTLEPPKPGEKRELTGAEIAIAAIIAAAGVARTRPEDARIPREPQPPGQKPVAQDGAGGHSLDVPIGFLPQFHVEGDAVSLKGSGQGEEGGEKAALEKPEEVHSRVAAPQPVMLRPTCLISERDTLVSLAEELFHDANLGWLIADLNADRIRQSWVEGRRVVEINNRQELVVPVWQDIVEFYQNRSAAAVPENLVTIVIATQVDRELLDSALGVVMGGQAAAAGQHGQFKPATSQTTSLFSSIPPLELVVKAGQDLKAIVEKIPEAAEETFSGMSDRWPKPPGAPATDDL